MGRSNWMPIYTAPLDGTAVLAVVKGFQPTVANFTEGNWAYHDEGVVDNALYEPTHWQPCPDFSDSAFPEDIPSAALDAPGMIGDEL